MKKKTKFSNYPLVVTQEVLEKVREWRQAGLTDKKIAESLGITPPTLYLWRKKYSEFESIWTETRRGAVTTPDLTDVPRLREKAVQMVEDSLFKRCMGMTVTEISISPEGKKWTKKKELPPDPNACLQWLRAHSERWKQAVQINVTGNSDKPEDNPLLGMKKSDLERLVKLAGEPVQ